MLSSTYTSSYHQEMSIQIITNYLQSTNVGCFRLYSCQVEMTRCILGPKKQVFSRGQKGSLEQKKSNVSFTKTKRCSGLQNYY